MVFNQKNPPEFPGNFPEKFLPGIFDISEIFSEIFPEVFSAFPRFYKNKKIAFRAVPLYFILENIPIFREFFRKFSRNFRGNFSGIFGISEISLKVSLKFYLNFLTFVQIKI